MVRLTLFDTQGRVVSYKGEPLPDDYRRLMRFWHRGRSPQSTAEELMHDLVENKREFQTEVADALHPETRQVVKMYQHGKPVYDRKGRLLGFEVLSVLHQPAGEEAGEAEEFKQYRRNHLWNTASSHLAELETHHLYSATHSVMVGVYGLAFGEVLDELIKNGSAPRELPKEYRQRNGFSQEELYELLIAGYLHDIGKKFVPAETMDKKGGLAEEEWKAVQGHLQLAIRPMLPLLSTAFAKRFIEQHHPYFIDPKKGDWRWEGRLAATVDVFHALSSKRSYREGQETGAEGAYKEMLASANKPASDSRRLDPELVEIFGKHFNEINERAMTHLREEIARREQELKKERANLDNAKKEGQSEGSISQISKAIEISEKANEALAKELAERTGWSNVR